ncbi:MAG: GNAT family N-acetyltransferase [Acidobacteria bacterium]|nr:MAG: GNAT family N-acetyltransferase [Acidobacteriota bacterium]REK01360.1 MAG: GNAT family N-acetyltransferase [Acidobacteriota bacterium]REK14316.1 MAG: GNAT family N-acetyltransferase [Acidobacteriota bacterium]REK45031.1 MAG: GNAT family N-acetyltransferase [Acidobacteriota bacterium]
MSTNANKIDPIDGDLVTLRFPVLEDATEFIESVLTSVELHAGLVHPPADTETFEAYVRKNHDGASACFVIVEHSSDEIAGAINMTQIYRGGFGSAYLGYYLFKGFTGRGLMESALRTLVAFALRDFGLHRLEANIQPHNSSSKRLVRKCGFTREGFSRKYLRIGGEWRDHERWAIIAEDLEN